MRWAEPGRAVLADGTALHHRCAELFGAERIRRLAAKPFTPEALADEAELMIRGEVLP